MFKTKNNNNLSRNFQAEDKDSFFFLMTMTDGRHKTQEQTMNDAQR